MEKIDRLSKGPDQKVRVENNNENRKLIKEEQIHSLVEVVVEGLEVDILEKIKKTRGKDKKIVRVVEKMKKVSIKTLRGNKQEIDSKIVLREGKVYIPKNEALRLEDTSSQEQREVEDNRVSNQKLLEAKSNKGCEKICSYDLC